MSGCSSTSGDLEPSGDTELCSGALAAIRVSSPSLVLAFFTRGFGLGLGRSGFFATVGGVESEEEWAGLAASGEVPSEGEGCSERSM